MLKKGFFGFWGQKFFGGPKSKFHELQIIYCYTKDRKKREKKSKRENEKREKFFENNYRNLLLDIINCVNKKEKKRIYFTLFLPYFICGDKD